MKVDVTKTKYYRYAADVINGKVTAGELVKLACSRFMSDLERDDLEFRADIVERFIEFSRLLKHFKGKSSGQPFVLEPWQQFIAANILGFYWKDGHRRFTNSLIFISRKQGKTALAALFCLWFLIGDGEDGAEVDLAANSLQQSQIAFEFCEHFARQLDPQQRDLRVYRKQINLPLNASKLNVFAADASRLDGFNAHFALIDEMHAAKDTRMYDVLKSSQGQRTNPHLMIISTAGFNIAGPLKRMYDVDVEILQGVKDDDSTFAMLFSLDEGDDWRDERNWGKIAPNLGVTVDRKYLREQVTQATNNPSAEVGILTKNFNQWCQTVETWIPDTYINKVTKSINLDDFDEETEVFCGVDLASVGDITAVTYLLHREDDPTHYFVTRYYLPESALTESPNRELYKYWARTDQLTITPGNVTDYQFITNDMMGMYNRYNVRKIAYDDWNSTQWAIQATELGLPLEPFSQSIGNFNKGTREFERIIRNGQCVIDNNEITRWMFRNVAIKTDHNGNIKPNKGAGAQKKIDGIISQITALGKWLETPRFSGSITVL